MGRTLPEWNQWARENGYSNLKEVILTLYWENGYSSRRLAKTLGISCQRLLQIMDALEIERRSRGGANR